MKKKQVNLRQLALKKSRVASLESDNLTGGTSGWTTGGFQSWTGTAEPCFTDFGCNPTNGCITVNCPPQTQNCPTNGCPPPTNGCGSNIGCNSDSVCPPGIQCY
ncbi:hypothetical protein [uncultured Kordia sp.]|uniref:hypothetical protein n=1 Tax=uncultured Kordia sp. TaxID=507699 RepID=UPI00262E62E9|nr:hypothetical protein [uncultured Kordia sp.]